MERREFIDIVDGRIAEVFAEYDLVVVERLARQVVFRSDLVEVRVIYDWRGRGELGMTFSRLIENDATRRFPLELMDLYRVGAQQGAKVPPSAFAGKEPAELRQFLSETARTLAEHFRDLLNGDEEAFRSALDARSRAAEEYTRSVSRTL